MNKLIVYPNAESNNLAVVTPAPNCELPIEEIARKDVPSGLPYKIFNYDDFPWNNNEFMDAWEADFSNPDGYGIGAEAWFAEQAEKEQA
jgi:hypothetical protein